MAGCWPNQGAKARMSDEPHEVGQKDTVAFDKIGSGESGCRDSSWRQKYTSGWRVGAILSCTVASAVLVINITSLLWAVSNFSMKNGFGTLYNGSCAHAKSLNTWIQLLINILSTTLLGASNYCMQCLASPTRQEIDKAHKRKHLLRIGVPSIRNLNAISRDRVMLWAGLGLSALPLHFL